jgi:hypothetical protein
MTPIAKTRPLRVFVVANPAIQYYIYESNASLAGKLNNDKHAANHKELRFWETRALCIDSLYLNSSFLQSVCTFSAGYLV